MDTATLLTAAAVIAQQTDNEYEPPNPAWAGQKLLAQSTGDCDVVETFSRQTESRS
jgi:hypothetical protein